MKALVIVQYDHVGDKPLIPPNDRLKVKSKWICYSLVAFFSTLLSSDTYGQIIQDVGGIAATVHAKTTFKDMPSNEEGTETKFQLNTYDAWLPLPPVTIGKTTVFSNFNYRLMDFNYENTAEQPDQIHRIQELKSVIIVRHPITEKWSVLTIAMPTFATESRKNISMKDLTIDGILGVSKRFGRHSNLEVGFGVHLMYSFGEFLVTPGISVDYRSVNNKWLAQFYWPRLNVLYAVNPKTQVGLAGSIDWTRFNLKNYQSVNNKEVDYGQFSSIHIGLQVHQQLVKGIKLQVQGGVGLWNSYEQFDNNQKTVNKFSIPTMPYAKVTLSYRLDKK